MEIVLIYDDLGFADYYNISTICVFFPQTTKKD